MFIDFSPLNISHRWLKKMDTWVFSSHLLCFPSHFICCLLFSLKFVRREFDNPRCPISICLALSQKKMNYAFFQLKSQPQKKRWPPPVVISRVPRNPFEGDEVQELSTKAVEIKDIESENHLIHSRHPFWRFVRFQIKYNSCRCCGIVGC